MCVCAFIFRFEVKVLKYKLFWVIHMYKTIKLWIKLLKETLKAPSLTYEYILESAHKFLVACTASKHGRLPFHIQPEQKMCILLYETKKVVFISPQMTDCVFSTSLTVRCYFSFYPSSQSK